MRRLFIATIWLLVAFLTCRVGTESVSAQGTGQAGAGTRASQAIAAEAVWIVTEDGHFDALRNSGHKADHAGSVHRTLSHRSLSGSSGGHRNTIAHGVACLVTRWGKIPIFSTTTTDLFPDSPPISRRKNLCHLAV